MFMRLRKPRSGSNSDLFTLKPSSVGSGVSLLPRNLTINGITKSPTFWYNGKDATLTGWSGEYGATVSLTGTGADPTLSQSPPFTDGTLGVKSPTSGSRAWQTAGTGDHLFGNSDIVFEATIKTGPNVTDAEYLFEKYDAAAGYTLYIASGNLYLLIRSASGTRFITIGAVAINTCYHIMAFVDKSGIGIGYLNTAVGSAASMYNETIDASVRFDIARSSPRGHTIYQLAGWNFGVGGLDTHLQPSLVYSRYALLNGIYAQTKGSTKAPNSLTCATSSTLERYDASTGITRFFIMGPNWPRNVCIKDFDGIVKSGLLQEATATNELTASDNPESWTRTNITKSVSTTESPFYDLTCNGLQTASTDGDVEHKMYMYATIAVTGHHCFHAFLAAGTKSWVRLKSIDASGNTVYCNFNLSTGLTGNNANCVGTTTGYGIKSLGTIGGKQWYQVFISYPGWTSTHAHSMFIMDTDSTATNPTYTGTDSVDIWMAHSQHDFSTDIPLSPVRTTGSATTRNHLQLGYKADDGAVPNTRTGSMEIIGWFENPIYATPSTARVPMCLTDGGVATEAVCPYWTISKTMTNYNRSAETGLASAPFGAALNTLGVSLSTIKMAWNLGQTGINDYLNNVFISRVLDTETVSNDIDRISILCNYALGEPTVRAIMQRFTYRSK